jgi:hypothetical protein
MFRRVAFGKAVVAGAAGAVAWELLARALIWLGVPFFDLVYVLGTMVVGRVDMWTWWPIGIVLHAAVGAIWAIFYGYFFWSDFNWSPTMQGLVFSLGPAFLAGVIMVPQMSFMHVMVLQGQLPYFNVEPACYIEEVGGLRHCDMILVTPTGAEVLTPFLTSIRELNIQCPVTSDE